MEVEKKMEEYERQITTEAENKGMCVQLSESHMKEYH